MTSNKILAVIPCLNEDKHIDGVVRHLVAHTQLLPIQIVIADGGSTDRTIELAKALTAEFSNVVYLHNPKKLQSAAVNLAVETYGVDAQWLIRLDAHAGYPDDYCQVLIAEAFATQAASIVVGMDTQGTGFWQNAAAAAQNSKLGNGGSAHRKAGAVGSFVDHGHHALMQIAAFRAVGGYDDSFSHNEDAELDHRLGKAGYKIWLTSKTDLVYYPRSTPFALYRQYFMFGKGRARTILKHKIIPKLRQMIPAAVTPAAVLFLFTPIHWIAAVPFMTWAFLCLAYGALLAVKAKKPQVVMAGPAAMLMHMGWSSGFWLGMTKILQGRSR